MKKITLLLLIASLSFPLTFIFAQEDSNITTDSSSVNADSPQTPPNNMPVPPPTKMPMAPTVFPGMMSRTVVATSDGGIVIVEGNKVTKLDQNLEITKSIELTNTENK
jgi:hypothetical protein